jgi:FtsH-binding integral membrane protein
MDHTYQSAQSFNRERQSPALQLVQSRFMNRTYGWMFLGLLITAVASWGVASSESAIRFIIANQWVFYGVLIAELVVVFGLSAAHKRISSTVAISGFLFYATLNGITFSVIFLSYQMTSIAQVFLLTAGMFGGLAIFGSITKKDLSGVGTFMMMGLFGIIILSMVNIFTKSDSLNFAISAAAIIIFSGLTAFDAQRIKSMASEFSGEMSDDERKGAIFGALALYLDFINLFLSLLRILGRRRN